MAFGLYTYSEGVSPKSRVATLGAYLETKIGKATLREWLRKRTPDRIYFNAGAGKRHTWSRLVASTLSSRMKWTCKLTGVTA